MSNQAISKQEEERQKLKAKTKKNIEYLEILNIPRSDLQKL